MKITIDANPLMEKLRSLNNAAHKFLVSNDGVSKMLNQAVQMGGHPMALQELGKAIEVNGQHGEKLGEALAGLMKFLREEAERNGDR